MKITLSPIQIRFVDIDNMGHVNNAVYLSYLEHARLHFFKERGGQTDWYNEGVILARIEINYVKPVILSDMIYVKTWCSRIGTKSFDLSYSIIKSNGPAETEVANALSVIVCFNYAQQKTFEIPAQWRQWLS